MMKLARFFRVLPALLLSLPASQHAAAQTSDVHTLKAALNYNFAKYTQWPATADDGYVDLCYFNDSFRPSFEPLVGRTIGPKTIRIHRLAGVSDAPACHLIFLDAENRALLEPLLAALGNQPVLTVADFAGFAEQGGMIEILTVENKLRFKVDLARLRESGIGLSSQVLVLATEVRR